MVTVSLVVVLDTRYTRVERTRCANHTSLHTRVQLLILQSDTTMCSHHWARARGVTRSWQQVTERVPSTDIDRAVNGDARRASLSMLLVSISLGLHWRHSEIRNELGVPLTLAVFTRSHPFLHGVTEEDLVRDPIQERVPCGHHSERERYPRFALSVANEGEKFRSCWTPYHRHATDAITDMLDSRDFRHSLYIRYIYRDFPP